MAHRHLTGIGTAIPISESTQRDGQGTARRGAVAELSVSVVAPAPNRTTCQYRARVIEARAHSGGIGDAREHETRRDSPAPNRATCQYRTRVAAAPGNSGGIGDARDDNEQGTGSYCAIAELAVAVVAQH
jgi:hypothetical protein